MTGTTIASDFFQPFDIASYLMLQFSFQANLFFNIIPELPIITLATEGIGARFLKIFWIIFLVPLGTFLFMYFYPTLAAKNRERAIKNDLPFVIIHMAAVAGSGAQPIAMFNLVLDSEEYVGLKDEIKKIVNYVNLFGYDISTALKVVSATTPSDRFKSLLTGIISNIESGSDLKNYLDAKATEALNTYKLERKKYTSTLSTYSDIYTGVFIAAPLLFIVTLVIINILGGKIGGIDVGVLAAIGTYGFIPFLILMFLLFLNVIQPKT